MKMPYAILKTTVLTSVISVLLAGCGDRYPVLDPKGPVGYEERHLIILSAILIAIVVIPVLILLTYIVYRYRDVPGNNAPYRPEWSDNVVLEIIWWGIPIILISILSFYTVKSIYALEKPPTTRSEPITIHVTSLDWKWLFQYPEQNIATVNYVEIPVNRPVQFILTADAPMNSFWIPQLGGQEYTMPGMAMRLWLQADKAGEYFGTGANFTGVGFAHMRFKVITESEQRFNQWVGNVKRTGQQMDMAEYERLREPGLSGERTYSSFPPDAYDMTLMKNGGHHMHE